MKHFFVKNQDGSVSDCNLPFKENDTSAVQLNVTEEQKNKVIEGTHDFDIVSGKVELKESNRKAEKMAKKQEIETKKAEVEILKEKLSKGQASNEEIQLTLAKLL